MSAMAAGADAPNTTSANSERRGMECMQVS
jgi:hypothetical protein